MKNKLRISLEDLLHLKRSEMPNEAFWQDFDRHLQERLQLEINNSARLHFKEIFYHYLKLLFRWAPAMACALICFGYAFLQGLKPTNRFVLAEDRYVPVQDLRQVPLKACDALTAMPVKKLIDGTQKMIAMSSRDRFSF